MVAVPLEGLHRQPGKVSLLFAHYFPKVSDWFNSQRKLDEDETRQRSIALRVAFTPPKRGARPNINPEAEALKRAERERFNATAQQLQSFLLGVIGLGNKK